MRILLLEDEPGVAAVYAVALRDSHDVVICTKFEDARSELRRQLPDALLTDIRLGEYNGLQLAILFRSLSPDGLIVAVSGHDDPVIRQEVEKLRAEFFVKPIELDTLRRRFNSNGPAH